MLINRLIEIAKREKRCDNPTQQQIADVCELSRSRISQIKADGEAASLSAEPLLVLTKLGYSAGWVQDGKGTMTMAQENPKIAHFAEHRHARLINVADKLLPEGVDQLVQYAETMLLPRYKRQQKRLRKGKAA
jgi:hypothetical protein